jgi:FkbM family methyltransferase
LERNRVENVIVAECVATDHEGTVTLEIVAGREEYSSIGNVVHPFVADEPSHRIDVQAITIDHLVAKHQLAPGFIKIDVEGAELHVLRGSRDTLSRHRPVVLCELSDLLLATLNATVEETCELLRECSYRIYDCATSLEMVPTKFHGNILAIPR